MLLIMRFIIFIAIGWTVLFFMHYFVYETAARVFSLSIPAAIPILAFLAISYFFASLLVRKINSTLTDQFYFLAASWLGVIMLLFSAVLPYELLHIFTGFESKFVLIALLLLGGLFSLYALWQGRNLVIREYVTPIAGLTKKLHVVHLSDIHVGTVHQEKFLERVVELTNKLSPDLVLISGDLFDGSVPIDEQILSPLDSLSAPSYFSHGNHEEYEGLPYVRETVKNLKLQLLENQMVIHEGIQLIGVNDRQSLPRAITLDSILSNLAVDTNLPSILMYHTPVEWESARKHGIDIMLSGHTHNGQVYPFNLLVRIFFRYVNGLYLEEGKYLHVTPGTGTWGPPMRLGSKNQVTLLKLVPKPIT